MQFPSRSARVALLAGVATLGLAGTASADTTAVLDGAGQLTVTFNEADDDVALGRVGANVELNGAPTNLPAANVTTIEVLELGDVVAANEVDLSAITGGAQGNYPNLTGARIKAAGGNDILTGSGVNDRIEGGIGDDIMSGGLGEDTLVWNPGEGNDTMDGDAGAADTIENNGAGAAEEFTIENAANQRVLFRRVNPLPFTLDIGTAERLVNNMQGGNDSFRTLDPAVPVNALAVTLNGGDGDDNLSGSDAADVLNGGNGNDRLAGFKGPDTMNGNDGDDTLVWNNGDNTDVMNGGDGIDTVENNGAAAGEQYTIDTVGGRIVFARSTQVAFNLTIGGAEKLVNNMLAGDDSFKTVDPARPVTGLAVTLNGGEGDDTLGGTDGTDTLNGGIGNDALTGFKGTDTANGDEGDDLMVWNNGDGSDKNEGGAGTDTAQLNGGAAGEHFVVTANGARVTATRDTQVPFFLDIGTSELLDLNGNAGDDSVDVGNGVGRILATDLALGDGNDTFRTRNDSSQRIDGGAGTDTAQIDATDIVANVETIDRPAVTPPVDPPAEKPDTVAPKVTIGARNLPVSGGRASLRVTCPAAEQSCTGRASIVRRGKVVGSIAVDLDGGERKTFKIALNRKTRIALSRERDDKLPVTVKVRLEDAAGNTGKASRQVNLKG